MTVDRRLINALLGNVESETNPSGNALGAAPPHVPLSSIFGLGPLAHSNALLASFVTPPTTPDTGLNALGSMFGAHAPIFAETPTAPAAPAFGLGPSAPSNALASFVTPPTTPDTGLNSLASLLGVQAPIFVEAPTAPAARVFGLGLGALAPSNALASL
jgi:hypothetical protein